MRCVRTEDVVVATHSLIVVVVKKWVHTVIVVAAPALVNHGGVK